MGTDSITAGAVGEGPAAWALLDDSAGSPATERRNPRECIVWSSRDSGEVRQFEIRLTPEDDGGYSVSVPRLPGVLSQGETEQEAIFNVREALLGALDEYGAQGRNPPLVDADRPLRGCIQRWITVHA